MNKEEFVKEVEKLGISVDDKILKSLNTYYEMLIDYNSHTNLTRITDEEEVYLKHFYDSLTIVKALDLNKNISVCDVGTGAGFPGLVLKIIFPNIKLTLVESITKKTIFINEIISYLDIKDVYVINNRVEEFALKNREKYDLVVCRAVSKLNIISELCIPIVKIGGFFIPMKGNIEEEIKNLSFLDKLNSKIVNIYEFNLPIENSKRNLVKIQKMKKTDDIYPRNYKSIKERPL